MFPGHFFSIIRRGRSRVPHLNPDNVSGLFPPPLFLNFLFYFIFLLGACDLEHSLCWGWCFVRGVSCDSFSLNTYTQVNMYATSFVCFWNLNIISGFFPHFYCGTSSIAELLKLPQSIKECTAMLCFRKLEIVGTLKWSYWGKKHKQTNKTFWWFCLPWNMPVGAFRIAVAVHHTVTFTNHSTVKELSFTFAESRSWHTCYTWQASQVKSNSLLRCPCVSSAT